MAFYGYKNVFLLQCMPYSESEHISWLKFQNGKRKEGNQLLYCAAPFAGWLALESSAECTQDWLYICQCLCHVAEDFS